VYFVIGRDGVIYYPARGLWLLSIDRFSLLRASFTHFGVPVDNSLRAGSRLGFMREMRDASGEATPREREPRPPRPTLSRLGRSSRGFATRVSHLAHKTQTRAFSQARWITYWYKQLIFSRWSRSGLVPDHPV